MGKWHRTRRADVGLRLAGLLLCALAYAAIQRLVASPPEARDPRFIAFALAAIGFLSASAGSAMILFGKHLFDQVEVSARWRRGYDDPQGPIADTLARRER